MEPATQRHGGSAGGKVIALSFAALSLCSLLTVSVRSELIDVRAVVKSRLEKIGENLQVDCRLDRPLAYCTVRCHDTNQLRAVYDQLRVLPAIALTATSPPGSVCVVLVYDTDEYLVQQRSKITESTLANISRAIQGKVLQVITGGVLVGEPDRPAIFVQDRSGLIDGEPFSGIVYSLGESYQFATTAGTVQTVAKYTADPDVAIKHWSGVIDTKAKQEVSRKTLRSDS